MERSYPLDEWRISETHFDPAMAARNETIFWLGNGHLGMRGNFEEGRCDVARGTYLNGFYEESPIVYGETAYGYAKNRQVMLNVADAKAVRLLVDGEQFDMSAGRLEGYRRVLDLSRGILARSLRWTSPRGKTIDLSIRRVVSLARPHVAAIDYRVTGVSPRLSVEIESAIDGAVTNQTGREDPRIGTRIEGRALQTLKCEARGTEMILVQETSRTKMRLACAASHAVSASPQVGIEPRCGENETAVRFRCSLAEGASVVVTKFIAYCTSRELAPDSLEAAAASDAASAREAGFDALAAEQVEYLNRFWAGADVQIEGDPAVQQGLRFNLFSLLQSAGRDGTTSVAAKGLSGEGYEGHYFWDTEIYAMPFFIYTEPGIARSLARYRCSILDKAKQRARVMSQRGALFPWRTIAGEECSPYYPAGTAQYHINADIVFALSKYLNAHPDRELLLDGRGAEVVFETARLWVDLGAWLPRRGDARPSLPAFAAVPDAGPHQDRPESEKLFYLNEVTGPDEYTALVDNNAYTNLMAKHNLEVAVSLAEGLQAEEPDAYLRIANEISLTDDEVEGWRRAAVAMYIPYDRSRGIVLQDDLFLNRAPWDFGGTPREKYPLLLHFHPLVIYRRQVLKQPDVVLAQVLRGECFSLAEKKRNYDFYDPLTTGDSSLSPCIQSVAATELGYLEAAYRYFMRTARMDLDDVNGNVSDGIHTAAMAGTWISLIYGFAGMRDTGGDLSFHPRLPEAWRRMRFSLQVHGFTLGVDITHETATYELAAADAATAADQGRGGGLVIRHRGRQIRLEPGKPAAAPLRPPLACVVFDLDGVITDTAEYHFRAWSRVAEEIGAPIDRAFNERLKGVSRMESLELILSHGSKKLSQTEKVELAERKNRYYRELIAQITPEDVLPGIAEMLRDLRRHSVRSAIASVSHNVWEVVKRLGIGELIDHIVDPTTVARGKPDPEIFLNGAEALGIPPEDCAGIEDAQAGIDAIRSAGMFAVGIGTSLAGADWRLPDTRGLTLAELSHRFTAHAAR